MCSGVEFVFAKGTLRINVIKIDDASKRWLEFTPGPKP